MQFIDANNNRSSILNFDRDSIINKDNKLPTVTSIIADDIRSIKNAQSILAFNRDDYSFYIGNVVRPYLPDINSGKSTCKLINILLI